MSRKSDQSAGGDRGILPDHVYLALGKVNADFATLEFFLKLFVGALIGTDQRTADILMANMPLRTIVEVAGALFRERYPEDEKARTVLDKLLQQVNDVEQRRNAVVHSFWLKDPTGVGVGRGKWRATRQKGYELQSEWFEPGELEEIAATIREVGAAVFNFFAATFPKKVFPELEKIRMKDRQ